MDLRIPVLQAPFRSALNPYVREADERVIDWVRDMGLSPSEHWLEGYRQAKFTWFAARCFPDADLPQLILASAFNVWLFLLDDSCDEVPPGQKRAYIQALDAELSLVLAGYPSSPKPLVRALAHLWTRLKGLGSADWQEHFTRGIQRYLDACKFEAQWLDLDAWPSLPAYLRTRPYLGAVHLEPALSEILCGHLLTPAYRKDSRVETLTLLCCNIVCWSNDLFSLEKERARGDKGNLALVLAHERKYGLGEAVREAAAIHDEDVRHFVGLARELGAAPGAVPARNTLPPLLLTPALIHYIRSLQNIVAANMEWSICDTRRYRFAFEEATPAYSVNFPR